MIKTLIAANRSEREKFNVPRSVQQSIPIRRIYKDGIWQVGEKYSRTWRFTDINYAVAGEDDQRIMFQSYSGVLNSLPTEATSKITICNRRHNQKEFERMMLMTEQGDGLDRYRKESNQIVMSSAVGRDNLMQDKYITVSASKKNIEDARTLFSRVDSDLSKNFARLSSSIQPLSNHERLRILHDIFRPGNEQYYRFDMSETMRKGHDFRDYICPDGLKVNFDHFIMGNRYGRVLVLREFASYLKDTLITELSDFPRNLVLSIDILPIPTDEAVKDMQSNILGIESDITRWQQKQNANNNFSARVPYDLEQLRNEATEFLDDLTSRDQRMMVATVTLVHFADSKEELDADTETLTTIGQKYLCQFGVLWAQQERGLNTALPYGLRRVQANRTMTTEGVAALIPFKVQEVSDIGGMFYGINPLPKKPIFCDRKKLQNPHGFVLGVSGSGKSVGMKTAISNIVLGTNDEVIIIDAEREYIPLAKAYGGSVIEFSPNSSQHINLMAMTDGYGDDENPIAAKSEMLMSVLEQQMGAGSLGAAQKSIIDRCTANVYRQARRAGGQSREVLLTDWRAEVLKQPENEAKEIALASEIIIEGSLNIFAHPTNVDLLNRITVLDLYEMGEQLRPTGLTVGLETIRNRVIQNRKRGVYTWVFIDECYLFFRYHYSAQFLYRAWKRFRKYGAPMTAATQNVEECLNSETARLMLANSEFLLLYNQASTDRAELAKLLNISQTQMSYITNAEVGSGLIRVGSAIVPFVNKIPRDTELYKLMTTTFGEAV